MTSDQVNEQPSSAGSDADIADSAVTGRIRSGEGEPAGMERAFAEAYARWSPLVHTVALLSSRTPAGAEHITQSVFLTAWRDRARVNPDGENFPVALIRIAQHHVEPRHQVASRPPSPQVSAPAHTSPHGDGRCTVLERVVLAEEFTHLPALHRQIMRLVFATGLAPDRIAEIVGAPIDTVRTHIGQSVRTLRDRLETAVQPVSVGQV